MKTVIFLDIDGVLVSYMDLKRTDEHGPRFVKHSVDALNKLIKVFDADICISSSWRKNRSKKDFQTLFMRRGVEGIVVDKTPVVEDNRGKEIKTWLDDNPEYDYYIIIDDEMVGIIDEIPYHPNTHIYTNPYRCLDIYDVAKITRKVWKDCEIFQNRLE